VEKIASEQLVILRADNSSSSPRIAVQADQLLRAIRHDAERGISPFDVLVRAEIEEYQWCEVQLTQEVWMRYLLRGHARADLFVEYVTSGFQNLFTLSEHLKTLHQNTDLWLRLKCFQYDLKRFDAQAQNRLESYGGEYYMSERYFSASEVTFLLSIPTASGATARQSLECLFSSKVSSGVVCTSHDIVPALERIYGIRKGFETDKSFQAYFKKFSAKKGTF